MREKDRRGRCIGGNHFAGGVRKSSGALAAPRDDYERVTALVNAHPEVAHNYERDHALNMWFVLACASREDIPLVLAEIEAETGCTVYDFPREAEYFIELKLSA